MWIGKGEEFAFGFLGGENSGPLAPDSAYITVTLASLRLIRIRTGLTTFCPVVHSQLIVTHRSGTDAEFQTVSTPSGLQDLDAAHLDRVIQSNVKLLGPVPYRAGDIRAEIGLFSLKTADLLQPYLALLGKISSAAGVGLIGRALAFAPLLTEGMQLLTGGTARQSLEVGLKGGIPARTGWFYIARAAKTDVDPGVLSVDPRDLRLLQAGNAPPWPYMLLHITASDRIGSWTDIPELKVAYDAVAAAAKGMKTAEVRDALAVFRATALFCPDLLIAHARELVRQVEAQVNEAMGGGGANLQVTATVQQREFDAAAIDPFI